MAEYTPITKTLKKATPKVRKSDGVVLEWEVEVVYRYEGNEAEGLPAWESVYSENKEVDHLGKTPDQFTKSELVGYMNPLVENHIFHAHYEAFNLPAKEERDTEFDVNSLSD